MTSPIQHIAVVTTVGSADEAQRIARSLVQRRLAACVQISVIESFYAWDGAVQNEPEWRLLCKTTGAQHDAVVAAIKELHSYELPAIHALALQQVDAAYGAWIQSHSTGSAEPDRAGDASAIRIRDVDHLVLRVVDLARMLGFYRDVLGCPVERRDDAIGLVQLRAGRSLIDLVPVNRPLGAAGGAPPGREGRNLDHFCLRLEPFDAAAIRRELEAAGITVGNVSTRYGAEGAGPSIYISDPEGNTVELKGPPDATR